MDTALAAIRVELAGRIAAIDRKAARATAGDLARELDQVRLLAQCHGLFPAVAVARLLESALARGEHGALVHGWLTILTDAVASDRRDGAACDAYAAACSVRLAG